MNLCYLLHFINHLYYIQYITPNEKVLPQFTTTAEKFAHMQFITRSLQIIPENMSV